VGGSTAERVNRGDGSGRLVVVVPGKVDLSKDLIFLGTPALPEEVDAAAIRKETEKAAAAGIRPFGATAAGVAAAAGGSPLALAARAGLSRGLSGVVRRFAPDESELARALADTGRR